jgi:hypothetical protein
MKLVQVSEAAIYDAITEAFTTAEAYGVHKDVVGAVFGVRTAAYGHWIKKRQIPKSPMYLYVAKLITAALRSLEAEGELHTDPGLTRIEKHNILVPKLTKRVLRVVHQ